LILRSMQPPRAVTSGTESASVWRTSATDAFGPVEVRNALDPPPDEIGVHSKAWRGTCRERRACESARQRVNVADRFGPCRPAARHIRGRGDRKRFHIALAAVFAHHQCRAGGHFVDRIPTGADGTCPEIRLIRLHSAPVFKRIPEDTLSSMTYAENPTFVRRK